MGIIKSAFLNNINISKKIIDGDAGFITYYHMIHDERLAHISNLYNYKSVDQFKSDLDFLLKNFSPAHPSVLLKEGKGIPKGQFIITFDDGLAELFENVRPLLNERGISALFLINTRYIDNTELMYKHVISLLIEKSRTTPTDLSTEQLKAIDFREQHELQSACELLNLDTEQFLKQHRPYMTSSELKTLVEEGHFLGGHTHSHFPLNKLTLEEQIVEIERPFKWMKENLNYSSDFHSFPFTDKYVSDALIEALYKRNKNLILLGNSGKKRHKFPKFYQRISTENPSLSIRQQVYSQLAYTKVMGRFL